MQPILHVHNLHKSFSTTFTNKQGKEERETAELLRGIDFELSEGSVTAIIGTNGSGKSTLFNIISGLMKPDKPKKNKRTLFYTFRIFKKPNKGNILYHYQNKEYNLCTLPSYKQARIGIARLFQGNNIFQGLSVLDNMLIADNNRMGEQAWEALFNLKKSKQVEIQRIAEAEKILSQLLGEANPLWEKRDQPAGNLSLGQQRLLAFARLLMNETATLFLLDEPTAGVNKNIRDTMIQMINTLKQNGKTILLIEHNIEFVQKVTDNVLYLDDGKIAMQGDFDKIISDKQVIENYLGKKRRYIGNGLQENS